MIWPCRWSLPGFHPGSVFPGGIRGWLMILSSHSQQEHRAGADPVWRCRNAPEMARLSHRNSPPFRAVEGSASQAVGADSSYPVCCLLFSFSPTRSRAFLAWLFRSLEAHKESRGWVMAVCTRWEGPDGCWRGRKRSECWVVRFGIPNQNASLDQTENYFEENKFSFMSVVLYIS